MNKYIIITDWLINYITTEPYTFCKELESYGWICVPISNTAYVSKILSEETIVLLITYVDLNISDYQIHPKCKIIYKIDDQHSYNRNAEILLETAWKIISPYAYLLKNTNKIWIPYSCIDTGIASIEYNTTPIYKIFKSGAVHKEHYPFRYYVLQLYLL